jgi:hypothetical protein
MDKLTKRKGFNFFRSYFDVYNELENIEDKVAFIDALLDRQFMGIKPTNLKGMAKFAYISQTNSIDSQVKGFEDKTGIILTPTDGGCVGGKTTPTEQVEVKEKVEVKNIVISIPKKTSEQIQNDLKELIDKKKKDFVEAIKPYKQNYTSQMLNDFYDYWTETKPNSKLIRWEREKAFDMSRRLDYWSRNDGKFGTTKQLQKVDKL